MLIRASYCATKAHSATTPDREKCETRGVSCEWRNRRQQRTRHRRDEQTSRRRVHTPLAAARQDDGAAKAKAENLLKARERKLSAIKIPELS